MDVGVLSLRGVRVLPFECRPGGDVLSRANPGEVLWLAFCGGPRGRWMQVGSALLEKRDDVVFPAFALSAVLSLATLAWVFSWLPLECAPRPPGRVMISSS